MRFEQLHIDVARYSTDDFNALHDPQRWRNIRGNPLGAPIVLGFQLEFLVADLIKRQRRAAAPLTEEASTPVFSNYDFVFASALRAEEPFAVTVNKTIDRRASGGGLSNRVVIRKADATPVVLGTQSDTACPRFLADADLTQVPMLDSLLDRIPVPGTPFFHKRKYLNTSNAKNFSLACLVDPGTYIDELAERVSFPPLFAVALLSNALLEKAWRAKYDFEANPMVYTRHQISVDHRLQRALRSNDCLHILVEGPLAPAGTQGLGQAVSERESFRCFGLVHGLNILFRANVELAPLHPTLPATG